MKKLTIAEQHGSRCAHYRSVIHFEQCVAGVTYADVEDTPPSKTGLRLPCFRRNEKNEKCPNRRWPTDEECQQVEQQWLRALEQLAQAEPLIARIKDEHKNDAIDWTGTVDCPVCGKPLHISHAAYNGHVSGRCETKDCLMWRE